ncbi:MAG TPA: septum formation initiator family protein [Clostridiaceae bacterium]|jgi:cell division protein FtsB|nr:septum formation initiator family protein [Clostridiaceae bacterium]
MNREKSPRWGLLILIAFMLYFLFIIVDQQKILDSKEEAMKNIQAKVEEEIVINEELKRQKEILDTDEYIEKVAREKLGMVKPGEKIFIDIN